MFSQKDVDDAAILTLQQPFYQSDPLLSQMHSLPLLAQPNLKKNAKTFISTGIYMYFMHWKQLCRYKKLCCRTLSNIEDIASPSAIVEETSVRTGFPAFKASEKLAHLSDSTPWNRQIYINSFLKVKYFQCLKILINTDDLSLTHNLWYCQEHFVRYECIWLIYENSNYW